MPRNSNGDYSLPAGNPVVTGEVISSGWANTTLGDIATALTGSLSRNGEGAMLAGLELYDGTIGAPGLTWGTETTSGLYRAGASDFRWAIAGSDILGLGTTVRGYAPALFSGITGSSVATSGVGVGQLGAGFPSVTWISATAPANERRWDAYVDTTTGTWSLATISDSGSAVAFPITVSRTGTAVDTVGLNSPTVCTGPYLSVESTDPELRFIESDGAADNRAWEVLVAGGRFDLYAVDDSRSTFTSFLRVDRTGTTIDTVNFPNGELQYGGLEVGFRGLNPSVTTGSENILSSDYGRAVVYTGSGGHTFTLQASAPAGSIVTILNAGTGNLTITVSGGNLFWFNGSGSYPSGDRTLAAAGVITAYSSGSSWYVWGTGLS